ncbi:hypothetical protein HOG17_02850 [Candidatus Peregrinibacteria bacterium]|jgi:flagellar hook assembly protein FlgD|nr:hypothetical protein [Candidatus Peregrinibacteria bacterium]MBT4366494.1 hypothetical protein [Candidatus Peregrinibacteria bacterium]MBT4456161.1 hypothetical protein [Candidatus Peregrinibacteria bacterium]
MVKKLISLLGVVGILSTLVVPAAFADNGDITLSVDGETTDEYVYVENNQPTLDIAFTKEVASVFTSLTINGDGDTLVDLTTGVTCENDIDCSVSWGGVDADGLELPTDDYEVVLVLDAVTFETDLEISHDLWIDIDDFEPDMLWDPSLDGDLVLDFEVSTSARVSFALLLDDEEVKTFNDVIATDDENYEGSFAWDGNDSGDYILPGDYQLEIKVQSYPLTFLVETVTIDLFVKYEDPSAPKLVVTSPAADADAADKAFTAEDEDVTVTFDLDGTAYVTVEIVVFDVEGEDEGTVVFIPSDFDGSDEYENEVLDFDWDGTKGIGDVVDEGLYAVVITARNDLGVAVDDTIVLDVTSEGSNYHPGGSKIKNIDLDPGGDWDPLEEKLDIEWELNVDFDTIKIEARKGGEVVEIYEEDDLSDKVYDTDFDGKDEDDEYIEPGEWTLLFLGDIDETTYYVETDFTVEYESPEIDEIFVTKKEIDPDLGEGVYFGFMLETDANVSVVVLKNGSSKVDLLGEDEKEEVEKDKWYAVYWDGLEDDGDDFDYDDTFKIQLEACSLGSDDDCETQSVTVDLDEDDVSSSKSNITMDMLIPPVTEEDSEVELTFEIEDDAEVKVAIWEGGTASGSPDVILMDYTLVPEGDYKFVWDTREEDGDVMDDGYYSYKIYTQKEGSSSTETETGKFVITDDLGDVFGGPSETGSSNDDDNGSSLLDNPYLVQIGGDDDDDDSGSNLGSNDNDDYSFVDVLPSNPNYDAIQWVASEGIFEGDPSGEFRPYASINRAEVLAVAMRAFDLNLYSDDGTTLGWNDVIPGAWYMSYLRSGKLYGLLSGDGLSNTVRPSDAVKRVEFLKFLYEGAKLAGVTVVPACQYNPYADVSVGNWYTGYVCQSKLDNLFTVIGDLFLPSVQASRAEVAEAIYRLLGN